MLTRVVNYKLGEDYDICIMRGTKWGNPFKIGEDGTREEVIAKYRKYVLETPELMACIHELRGKVLGCCCKPYDCHGDVLVELANKPFRVIVFGGRNFNDYELMERTLSNLLLYYEPEQVTIVSGHARGADALGERFAKEYGLTLDIHPVDWNTHGNSAGYVRNVEMAQVADAAVGYWDGESRGTKHMIDTAKRYNLQVRVVKYQWKDE